MAKLPAASDSGGVHEGYLRYTCMYVHNTMRQVGTTSHWLETVGSWLEAIAGSGQWGSGRSQAVRGARQLDASSRHNPIRLLLAAPTCTCSAWMDGPGSGSRRGAAREGSRRVYQQPSLAQIAALVRRSQTSPQTRSALRRIPPYAYLSVVDSKPGNQHTEHWSNTRTHHSNRLDERVGARSPTQRY